MGRERRKMGCKTGRAGAPKGSPRPALIAALFALTDQMAAELCGVRPSRVEEFKGKISMGDYRPVSEQVALALVV
jgi:hypothetical protein